MGRDIANMSPSSGQMLKDNNEVVNVAEKIEAIETAAGTNGTGITPPTGATGILGWLSGIYNLLFGGTAKVQLSGSKVCLSSEAKPAGEQGDTLLEYDEITGETKVYKYISGDWREL
jgi:hypothetical protein